MWSASICRRGINGNSVPAVASASARRATPTKRRPRRTAGVAHRRSSKNTGRASSSSSITVTESRDKTPRKSCCAGPVGQDFAGPHITTPGWWTLGMSFSPDGQVHYYAARRRRKPPPERSSVVAISLRHAVRAAQHVLLQHRERRQRPLVERRGSSTIRRCITRVKAPGAATDWREDFRLKHRVTRRRITSP